MSLGRKETRVATRRLRLVSVERTEATGRSRDVVEWVWAGRKRRRTEVPKYRRGDEGYHRTVVAGRGCLPKPEAGRVRTGEDDHE